MARHEKLTLANLRLLDGNVLGEAFDREMERIIADCQDRPNLDKERSIAIVFTVKPKPDVHAPNPNSDEIMTQVQIHSSIPKRKTKVYTMRTKADNTATFHPDLPDEPEEGTLYDKDAKRRDDKTK